jgi:allantoinase
MATSPDPNGARTILRSRRVLVAGGVRAADLLVEGERIRELRGHGAAPGEGEAVVELGDDLLMPAAIDVHVHVDEPGRTEWEGFASASRAAAAGGIALLVDMPLNSEPVTTTAAAFEAKLEAARAGAIVDVALHAGVVPENAGDPRTLAELALAGAAGFKCFLCDSGLPTFPPLGRDQLRAAMRHLAPLGRRLLAHCEVFAAPPPASLGRRHADYLASRPPGAECAAIALLVELARETGCPVHVVHLAAAEALPLLAAARADGLDVTVETCPHYLTFAAEEIADGDTVAKCAPPLRSAANREALWDALARGAIDFVASDHSPCPPELKRLDDGDFGTAWGGIASLQLLLPALWTGATARGLGVERVAEWLARRPARWLGLDGRGELAPGARADLVAWRPEERFVVRGDTLHHRYPLTPYAGRQLSGVVTRTWIGGAEVYRDGAFVGRPGAPQRIRGGFARAEREGFARFARRSPGEARAALAPCCGSRRWLERLLAGWPYASARTLFAASERAFDTLAASDWDEAFAAHPRIGDLEALRLRHAERAEQAGAAAADPATLAALAAGNREYERRFGFVFLVCAAGRSAAELLDALRSRLGNALAAERALAAEEQRKITCRRLARLLEREREEVA